MKDIRKIMQNYEKTAGIRQADEAYYGSRLAQGREAAVFRSKFDANNPINVGQAKNIQRLQGWKNTEKKLRAMEPAQRKAAELKLLKMLHK